MQLAERRHRQRLELAAAALLLLPRHSKPVVVSAVRRAIVVGATEAFETGAKTGITDVYRIGTKAEARIAPIEIEVPYKIIDKRATAAADAYADADLASFRDRADIVTKYGERAAARDAISKEAYRLNRISTSESATAFNEARRETVRQSVKSARADEALVVRVWQVDGNPCPLCLSNDGNEAPLYGSYPSGDEPGSVHPHCMCFESYRINH